MAQVGQTYNKLEAFLNEIQRQQSAQQEAGKGKTDATAVEETPQGE
jgi:hypothetical protein